MNIRSLICKEWYRGFMTLRAAVVCAFVVLSIFAMVKDGFCTVIDIDMHPVEREMLDRTCRDRDNRESKERVSEGRGSARDHERAEQWDRDHTS